MPLPSPNLLPGPGTLPGAGSGTPVIQPGPIPFEPASPMRAIDFQVEILDADEVRIGEVESATGGSIEWSATASVKGTGTLEVVDVGQDIDWLTCRIRITAILSSVSGSPGVLGVPLGVFVPAAPVTKWEDTGRSWSVELTDKLAILDQDIPLNSDGDPYVYSVAPGQDVTTVVRGLIQGAGESTVGIEPGGQQVTKAMTWEIGTTRLQIINDLLAASGYLSLWCDKHGQYRVTPYVAPAQRPVIYEAQTPLTRGQMSLMSPDYTHDQDIYAIPNKYVAVSGGSGEEAAMVAVAVNDGPASRFSKEGRGRWIVHTETGVDAMTQADLEAKAEQGLAALTGVASSIEVEHVFLPDLTINSAVRFENPAAGQALHCTVASTSISLDPTGLCRSTLTEALT